MAWAPLEVGELERRVGLGVVWWEGRLVVDPPAVKWFVEEKYSGKR